MRAPQKRSRATFRLHARERFSRSRRAGRELALDEATNVVVRGPRQRTHVAVARVALASQPSKHVGAREMERRVALQRLAADDRVDLREAFRGAGHERQRHRPVQLDDGRALVAKELGVQW